MSVNKKKKKITGCLLIVAAVLIAAFVCVLGLAAGATAAVFDEKPKKPERLPTNQEARQTAIKKLLGTVWLPNEVQTLTLNEDEVKALLSVSEDPDAMAMLSAVGLRQADLDQLKDLALRFKDGKFHLYCAKRMDFSTPFGNYINVYAAFTPHIKGIERGIDVHSAKFGDILAPGFLFDTQVDEMVNVIKANQEYDAYLSIIEELKVDENNNLIIRYYPLKLRKVMNSFFTKGLKG